ncbi:CHAP domain-containing protein [Phytohabitans sp. LJ34]|uniref:CHAP domain-containing protein n=1 Tax=Phytohabitans sp. LJ34 TaxID=3452217 RepID=UPI003F88C6BE
MIIGVGTPAQALGDNYPWPNANMDALSPLRFAYRNCTDYAAWTINTQMGGSIGDYRFQWANIQYNGSGHAREWRMGAISRGIPVNGNPQRGAVAWWGSAYGGDYGHVAIVADVRNGGNTIDVHEYNANWNGRFGVRTLQRGTSAWPQDFLHIADINDPPAQHRTDVNGDGRGDLTLIATGLNGPTGSGRLEAHALNGATGYSSWLGNWATAAGYLGSATDRVLMGDVNGDSRADLVLVATGQSGPTGSGKLEAHVLDGATGYSTWMHHWATAAGYLNPSDDLVMGDVNGDNRADLVIVGTGRLSPTGSGRLEAHVLNAATGYGTWLGNWATAAGYISANDRLTMGDVNGDNRADLVIVATGLAGPTGSGRLEAHVLNGGTSFGSWLGNWATAAGYLGTSSDLVVMGDVDGDSRADLTIVGTGQAGPTGSGRLEAHVLNGATAFGTWTSHWATAAGYLGVGDRLVMS